MIGSIIPVGKPWHHRGIDTHLNLRLKLIPVRISIFIYFWPTTILIQLRVSWKIHDTRERDCVKRSILIRFNHKPSNISLTLNLMERYLKKTRFLLTFKKVHLREKAFVESFNDTGPPQQNWENLPASRSSAHPFVLSLLPTITSWKPR